MAPIPGAPRGQQQPKYRYLMFALMLLLAAAPDSADLIIVNANVWTGDAARPRAEAVAIAGDRIAAVGTTAQIAAMRGPKTRLVDARGRLLLPGFNDAHVHFVQGGMQLDQVDLKDAASPADFARRIGGRAAARPGEWIVGGNWDEQAWPGAPLPTRELIDRVAPTTPVFVSRYDGHMAVANSAALAAAKVTSATPDPPGGAIVRDAQGRPTGVLRDAAMNYVFRIIPPLPAGRRLEAVERAIAHAVSLGVTTVQDMGTDAEDLAAYTAAGPGLRIYGVPAISTPLEQVRKRGARAVKAFADGSLGSATAYFFEPYTDAPNARGLLMQPAERLREWFMTFHRSGIQLCTHAIGDAAISMVLDEYERLGVTAASRHRIEHAQHMAPRDFARMARLGVIASVQPYHAIDDGRWAERRIGPARAKTTYAFRSFIDNKVRLALGTDWPVAPLSPFETIYAAVTRATLDSKRPGGWVPEQKITVEEAVRAYTAGSAWAEFQENSKGVIAPGRYADMVLLDRDIFRVLPAEIRGTRVETTIVGGKVVWPQ